MIPAAQRYRTAQARALLPDRQVWDADAHVAPQNVDQRDIYYVVLDGYGRADVLQQEYGFQSPGLVEFLERRGFVVAKKSMANYRSVVRFYNKRVLQATKTSCRFGVLRSRAGR